MTLSVKCCGFVLATENVCSQVIHRVRKFQSPAAGAQGKGFSRAAMNENSELRYAQQQIGVEIDALQTAQQGLQRSIAKPAAPWFSERNALLYQGIAPTSKPRTAARRRQMTSTREANADPRNANGPLPLVRSQPTATGAVPIR